MEKLINRVEKLEEKDAKKMVEPDMVGGGKINELNTLIYRGIICC